MQKSELSNINISEEQVLITPEELKAKIPLSDNARRFIQESRQTIANIIHKKIIAYWLYVVLAQFTIWTQRKSTLSVLKHCLSSSATSFTLLCASTSRNHVPQWVGKV